MKLRYSFVAVGLASAVVAGCNMSQDRSTATFESTMEANAAAAEAAEAEVAKLNDLDAADEKTVHGEGIKAGHGKKSKSAKESDHKTAERKADGRTKGHKTAPNKTAEHKTTEHKTPRKPASNSKNNVFIVQVGAFRIKENAERLHSKLKAEGFPVLMREMNHSKNGLLFLVRLEPTPNRQEAETMAASLKTKSEMTPAIIVRPEGD